MPRLPGPEVLIVPVLIMLSSFPPFVLIAAELTVVMVPVLIIVLRPPPANIPRELFPSVLMLPVFMILFDPSLA